MDKSLVVLQCLIISISAKKNRRIPEHRYLRGGGGGGGGSNSVSVDPDSFEIPDGFVFYEK